MYLYMYVYIYVYIYMYMYMYVYIYIYINVYIIYLSKCADSTWNSALTSKSASTWKSAPTSKVHWLEKVRWLELERSAPTWQNVSNSKGIPPSKNAPIWKSTCFHVSPANLNPTKVSSVESSAKSYGVHSSSLDSSVQSSKWSRTLIHQEVRPQVQAWLSWSDPGSVNP